MPEATVPGLRITRLHVRRGRLDILTSTPLALLHVSEDVAQRTLQLLPNLRNHVCVHTRAGGGTFGGELVGTELAHLFEHVVIELQAQAHGGAAAAGTRGAQPQAPGGVVAGTPPQAPQLIGHTSWAEELAVTGPQGYALMRTTVTFANDLVALQAAKDAVELLNWACAPEAPQPALDVAALVERLRGLAARSR